MAITKPGVPGSFQANLGDLEKAFPYDPQRAYGDEGPTLPTPTPAPAPAPPAEPQAVAYDPQLAYEPATAPDLPPPPPDQMAPPETISEAVGERAFQPNIMELLSQGAFGVQSGPDLMETQVAALEGLQTPEMLQIQRRQYEQDWKDRGVPTPLVHTVDRLARRQGVTPYTYNLDPETGLERRTGGYGIDFLGDITDEPTADAAAWPGRVDTDGFEWLRLFPAKHHAKLREYAVQYRERTALYAAPLPDSTVQIQQLNAEEARKAPEMGDDITRIDENLLSLQQRKTELTSKYTTSVSGTIDMDPGATYEPGLDTPADIESALVAVSNEIAQLEAHRKRLMADSTIPERQRPFTRLDDQGQPRLDDTPDRLITSDSDLRSDAAYGGWLENYDPSYVQAPQSVVGQTLLPGYSEYTGEPKPGQLTLEQRQQRFEEKYGVPITAAVIPRYSSRAGKLIGELENIRENTELTEEQRIAAASKVRAKYGLKPGEPTSRLDVYIESVRRELEPQLRNAMRTVLLRGDIDAYRNYLFTHGFTDPNDLQLVIVKDQFGKNQWALEVPEELREQYFGGYVGESEEDRNARIRKMLPFAKEWMSTLTLPADDIRYHNIEKIKAFVDVADEIFGAVETSEVDPETGKRITRRLNFDDAVVRKVKSLKRDARNLPRGPEGILFGFTKAKEWIFDELGRQDIINALYGMDEKEAIDLISKLAADGGYYESNRVNPDTGKLINEPTGDTAPDRFEIQDLVKTLKMLRDDSLTVRKHLRQGIMNNLGFTEEDMAGLDSWEQTVQYSDYYRPKYPSRWGIDNPAMILHRQAWLTHSNYRHGDDAIRSLNQALTVDLGDLHYAQQTLENGVPNATYDTLEQMRRAAPIDYIMLSKTLNNRRVPSYIRNSVAGRFAWAKESRPMPVKFAIPFFQAVWGVTSTAIANPKNASERQKQRAFNVYKNYLWRSQPASDDAAFVERFIYPYLEHLKDHGEGRVSVADAIDRWNLSAYEYREAAKRVLQEAWLPANRRSSFLKDIDVDPALQQRLVTNFFMDGEVVAASAFALIQGDPWINPNTGMRRFPVTDELLEQLVLQNADEWQAQARREKPDHAYNLIEAGVPYGIGTMFDLEPTTMTPAVAGLPTVEQAIGLRARRYAGEHLSMANTVDFSQDYMAEQTVDRLGFLMKSVSQRPGQTHLTGELAHAHLTALLRAGNGEFFDNIQGTLQRAYGDTSTWQDIGDFFDLSMRYSVNANFQALVRMAVGTADTISTTAEVGLGSLGEMIFDEDSSHLYETYFDERTGQRLFRPTPSGPGDAAVMSAFIRTRNPLFRNAVKANASELLDTTETLRYALSALKNHYAHVFSDFDSFQGYAYHDPVGALLDIGSVFQIAGAIKLPAGAARTVHHQNVMKLVTKLQRRARRQGRKPLMGKLRDMVFTQEKPIFRQVVHQQPTLGFGRTPDGTIVPLHAIEEAYRTKPFIRSERVSKLLKTDTIEITPIGNERGLVSKALFERPARPAVRKQIPYDDVEGLSTRYVNKLDDGIAPGMVTGTPSALEKVGIELHGVIEDLGGANNIPKVRQQVAQAKRAAQSSDPAVRRLYSKKDRARVKAQEAKLKRIDALRKELRKEYDLRPEYRTVDEGHQTGRFWDPPGRSASSIYSQRRVPLVSLRELLVGKAAVRLYGRMTEKTATFGGPVRHEYGHTMTAIARGQDFLDTNWPVIGPAFKWANRVRLESIANGSGMGVVAGYTAPLRQTVGETTRFILEQGEQGIRKTRMQSTLVAEAVEQGLGMRELLHNPWAATRAVLDNGNPNILDWTVPTPESYVFRPATKNRSTTANMRDVQRELAAGWFPAEQGRELTPPWRKLKEEQPRAPKDEAWKERQRGFELDSATDATTSGEHSHNVQSPEPGPSVVYDPYEPSALTDPQFIRRPVGEVVEELLAQRSYEDILQEFRRKQRPSNVSKGQWEKQVKRDARDAFNKQAIDPNTVRIEVRVKNGAHPNETMLLNLEDLGFVDSKGMAGKALTEATKKIRDSADVMHPLLILQQEQLRAASKGQVAEAGAVWESEIRNAVMRMPDGSWTQFPVLADDYARLKDTMSMRLMKMMETGMVDDLNVVSKYSKSRHSLKLEIELADISLDGVPLEGPHRKGLETVEWAMAHEGMKIKLVPGVDDLDAFPEYVADYTNPVTRSHGNSNHIAFEQRGVEPSVVSQNVFGAAFDDLFPTPGHYADFRTILKQVERERGGQPTVRRRATSRKTVGTKKQRRVRRENTHEAVRRYREHIDENLKDAYRLDPLKEYDVAGVHQIESIKGDVAGERVVFRTGQKIVLDPIDLGLLVKNGTNYVPSPGLARVLADQSDSLIVSLRHLSGGASHANAAKLLLDVADSGGDINSHIFVTPYKAGELGESLVALDSVLESGGLRPNLRRRQRQAQSFIEAATDANLDRALALPATSLDDLSRNQLDLAMRNIFGNNLRRRETSVKLTSNSERVMTTESGARTGQILNKTAENIQRIDVPFVQHHADTKFFLYYYADDLGREFPVNLTSLAEFVSTHADDVKMIHEAIAVDQFAAPQFFYGYDLSDHPLGKRLFGAKKDKEHLQRALNRIHKTMGDHAEGVKAGALPEEGIQKNTDYARKINLERLSRNPKAAVHAALSTLTYKSRSAFMQWLDHDVLPTSVKRNKTILQEWIDAGLVDVAGDSVVLSDVGYTAGMYAVEYTDAYYKTAALYGMMYNKAHYTGGAWDFYNWRQYLPREYHHVIDLFGDTLSDARAALTMDNIEWVRQSGWNRSASASAAAQRYHTTAYLTNYELYFRASDPAILLRRTMAHNIKRMADSLGELQQAQGARNGRTMMALTPYDAYMLARTDLKGSTSRVLTLRSALKDGRILKGERLESGGYRNPDPKLFMELSTSELHSNLLRDTSTVQHLTSKPLKTTARGAKRAAGAVLRKEFENVSEFYGAKTVDELNRVFRAKMDQLDRSKKPRRIVEADKSEMAHQYYEDHARIVLREAKIEIETARPELKDGFDFRHIFGDLGEAEGSLFIRRDVAAALGMTQRYQQDWIHHTVGNRQAQTYANLGMLPWAAQKGAGAAKTVVPQILELGYQAAEGLTKHWVTRNFKKAKLFMSWHGPATRNMFANMLAMARLHREAVINRDTWVGFGEYWTDIRHGNFEVSEAGKEIVSAGIVQSGISMEAGFKELAPYAERVNNRVNKLVNEAERFESRIKAAAEISDELAELERVYAGHDLARQVQNWFEREGRALFELYPGLTSFLDDTLEKMPTRDRAKMADLIDEAIEAGLADDTKRGITRKMFDTVGDIGGYVFRPTVLQPKGHANKLVKAMTQLFNDTDDAFKYAIAYYYYQRGLRGPKLFKKVMETWPNYAEVADWERMYTMKEVFGVYETKYFQIMGREAAANPLLFNGLKTAHMVMMMNELSDPDTMAAYEQRPGYRWDHMMDSPLGLLDTGMANIVSSARLEHTAFNNPYTQSLSAVFATGGAGSPYAKEDIEWGSQRHMGDVLRTMTDLFYGSGQVNLLELGFNVLQDYLKYDEVMKPGDTRGWLLSLLKDRLLMRTAEASGPRMSAFFASLAKEPYPIGTDRLATPFWESLFKLMTGLQRIPEDKDVIRKKLGRSRAAIADIIDQQARDARRDYSRSVKQGRRASIPVRELVKRQGDRDELENLVIARQLAEILGYGSIPNMLSIVREARKMAEERGFQRTDLTPAETARRGDILTVDEINLEESRLLDELMKSNQKLPGGY